MRQRNSNQSGGYTDRISMKGVLPQWRMCGVVQMVHSNNSSKYPADFVRFQIRPAGKENDENAFGVVFAVTVPDSLGWQLERGDKVYMEGSITSWKNDNGFRIELVASLVKPWDGLFKHERQAAGYQSGAPERAARRRIGDAAPQEMPPGSENMIERRGHQLYPSGMAPAEKPAPQPEASETVDFAEFEGEVIGASGPLPFE